MLYSATYHYEGEIILYRIVDVDDEMVCNGGGGCRVTVLWRRARPNLFATISVSIKGTQRDLRVRGVKQ